MDAKARPWSCWSLLRDLLIEVHFPRHEISRWTAGWLGSLIWVGVLGQLGAGTSELDCEASGTLPSQLAQWLEPCSTDFTPF